MCQKIRFATIDDTLNIYNLEKLSIKEASSYDMILKEMRDNSLAHYLISENTLEHTKNITNKTTDRIVYKTNGKINTVFTGYLGYWQLADEYHITNIAIDPAFRGKGYAKALINKLIDIATEKNIIAISLEVRHSNINAIKLYENTGFRNIGIRPKYYTDGENALIMTLKI